MTPEQLKQKAIKRIEGCMIGAKRYLDQHPDNVFMLNHYSKLSKMLEDIINYKIQ